MTTPQPGTPVRGSSTGEPIMALLDLLGRRWTLRIIWQLRDEALSFRELQAQCDGMSASVLAQRIKELRDADVIDAKASPSGYRLTDEGRLLLDAYAPYHAWAKRWAARVREREASASEPRNPPGERGLPLRPSGHP